MAQLTDFTFRDTGISVKIKKVTPWLSADIEASIPLPEPPAQEVDYGEPRGKVLEKNFSDPTYEGALAARRIAVYRAYRRALIKLGVVPSDEDWQKAVTEYRNFILSNTGKPLDEQDDLIVYVLRICIGTLEDQEDLITAITRRSQPTAEAVDQAKASF